MNVMDKQTKINSTVDHRETGHANKGSVSLVVSGLTTHVTM